MKPILFSTPMVQAILEGRKTQTRRVVKPQPDEDGLAKFILSQRWEDTSGKVYPCPYGQPGDVLWVRENYLKPPITSDKMIRDGADTWPKFEYVASCSETEIEQYKDWGWKLKPSIHMPNAACRLFLQIESVRVERLQEISEADAIAEGVTDFGKQEFHPIWTAKKAFKSLWQFINGTESWEANPWVWVVTFKKIEKP